MSKLTDYSKFDHLDSSDEEEDGVSKPDPPQAPASTAAHSFPAAGPAATHTTPRQQPQQPNNNTPVFRQSTIHPHRFILEYAGHAVYEWEQSLNEVTLYIPTPPQQIRQAHDIVCHIHPQSLQVGVRNNDRYFIDECTAGTVDVKSSTWTWEKQQQKDGSNGGLLTIELFKANKGVVWEAACLGANAALQVRLDPLQLEQEKRRLMLERFQEENAGFDFRDATFNGSAPDPRTFMGGVQYR